MANISGDEFSEFVKSRRSIRDFKPDPIPDEILNRILDDAKWAPSWTNTQPYFLAIASGEKKDRIKAAYLKKYDESLPIQRREKFSKLKESNSVGGFTSSSSFLFSNIFLYLSAMIYPIFYDLSHFHLFSLI